MKFLPVLLVSFLFSCLFAVAQVAPVTPPARVVRHVAVKFIGKDSVRLALNEDYDRIEDSCSQVIRYGHINKPLHRYYGKIKDVSSLDTTMVLTEGNYTADGFKDGSFITHYLNGALQAKGNFKNNRYDGKWEIYYDDGKPNLFFEADGKNIKITDVWDEKGDKIVDNGNGNYRDKLGAIYWEGKLLNGRPDGTWIAAKTDDATHTSIATEKFKDGAFQKGTSPLGSYSDTSRMELVSASMLPFMRAEAIRISPVPCNGTKRKHLVRAQYSLGAAAFGERIKELVRPYFSKFNIKLYDMQFAVEGEISETGKIIKLTSNSPGQGFIEGLIEQLQRLPPLQPATADGKPVAEKFSISFVLDRGLYHYTTRFGAVIDK